MKKSGLIIKRVCDIGLSLFLLVFLSPLLIFSAILVKKSMGSPVFFRQPRIGLQGSEFRIFKFRTMTESYDSDGQLLSDDKRITKVGSFLRKTTFDELPELFNVLIGQMSIVGPRPLLTEYRDRYDESQWRRHEMPPGMAGPVLANGRNSVNWDQKFILDLDYVDNWSLLLDAKIFFKTFWAVISRKGISAEGHISMPIFEGNTEEKKTK